MAGVPLDGAPESAGGGMNAPAVIVRETLPAIIDRASRVLAGATSSGEILEAIQIAADGYDRAKRLARRKSAHDDVIEAAMLAQRDILVIEGRAKAMLADEYDAAQERGEIRSRADNQAFSNSEKASAADIGLTPKQIHEARQIRDAERADPGIVEASLNAALERGDEPSRAEMRRSVLAAVKDAQNSPKKQKNPLHRKDPDRDRVLRFTSICAEIAEFGEIDAIAAWQGPEFSRARLVEKARAARTVIEAVLSLCGEQNA